MKIMDRKEESDRLFDSDEYPYEQNFTTPIIELDSDDGSYYISNPVQHEQNSLCEPSMNMNFPGICGKLNDTGRRPYSLLKENYNTKLDNRFDEFKISPLNSPEKLNNSDIFNNGFSFENIQPLDCTSSEIKSEPLIQDNLDDSSLFPETLDIGLIDNLIHRENLEEIPISYDTNSSHRDSFHQEPVTYTNGYEHTRYTSHANVWLHPVPHELRGLVSPDGLKEDEEGYGDSCPDGLKEDEEDDGDSCPDGLKEDEKGCGDLCPVGLKADEKLCSEKKACGTLFVFRNNSKVIKVDHNYSKKRGLESDEEDDEPVKKRRSEVDEDFSPYQKPKRRAGRPRTNFTKSGGTQKIQKQVQKTKVTKRTTQASNKLKKCSTVPYDRREQHNQAERERRDTLKKNLDIVEDTCPNNILQMTQIALQSEKTNKSDEYENNENNFTVDVLKKLDELSRKEPVNHRHKCKKASRNSKMVVLLSSTYHICSLEKELKIRESHLTQVKKQYEEYLKRMNPTKVSKRIKKKLLVDVY